MSEIRYDRLYDNHVIIAPERLHHPDFACVIPDDPSRSECPFCEGNESMTPPEIFAVRPVNTFSNERGWQTRVVPNLYKAVQIEAPYIHHFGLHEYWEGFGAHEVIIDTPQHHTSMEEWDDTQIGLWLKTLKQRFGDLRRDTRIAHITLFKNEGISGGSTQPHCHTQVIGLPLIPKREREQFLREVEYYQSTAKGLMQSILQHEEEAGDRIVDREGEFSAYCPYASAYPFELIISSSQKIGQIDTLSEGHIEQLSKILYRILKKLKRQLRILHFNLSITTPPLQSLHEGMDIPVDEVHQFSIRIMPRIYTHGGFELTTGILINPVAPEVAAKLLKEG
ncbi:UTP--glucose-1-phosphate uridylyltransferase [Sulfuricurvum sp.]|uniref:UTP--glucose-1-phosphate uridylyltransferase n=1 Tax=Sulfuricurvum sp. TaxID=2025608 RepID=UPI003BB18EB1